MGNNKKRIMMIFGTRPEAIKLAPLSHALAGSDDFEHVVCVTAQHRQMLDQVLDIFGLVPDYDLNIMEERQTLSTITKKALEGLEKVFLEAKPDLVLVHGDTSTTFGGALAAFYQKIPVGHVEAGLRTFDNYSPYPEEMNRKLTGQIAELHFAPTRANEKNLKREGIENNVFVTGNTVIDAIHQTVRRDFSFRNETLKSLQGEGKRLILLTAHRRENYGRPLENILRAVRRIADDFEDVRIVYPVHLSPYVQQMAGERLGGHARISLIEPIAVDEMHNLMARSHLVLTDSGGLQEEAPSFGKPVLVLRQETERPEAVDAGTVKLAGVDENEIYSLSRQLLTDEALYESMAMAVNPYGDGRASERIVAALSYYFGKAEAPPAPFEPKRS